jgi:hypothetical protein
MLRDLSEDYSPRADPRATSLGESLTEDFVGSGEMTHLTLDIMPIRPSLRWFYPIDWPQLSREIRFGRARGCCEVCSRRHKTKVLCLPDGRWFDRDENRWRDGRGNQCVPPWGSDLDQLRATRVILAAAHLDHDPANSALSNLKSLCQRCHMIHDRPYHLAQRCLTYRMRWAIGDLFLGPYVRGRLQSGRQ